MEKGEEYKCTICGNIVEIKEVGGGTLVCCEKHMVLLNNEESITKEDLEKMHMPSIEIRGEKDIFVRVGEPLHPMTEEHYIKWIEISVDGALYVKSLNPWDKAEAVFKVPVGRKIAVRAMCNLHNVYKRVYGV